MMIRFVRVVACVSVLWAVAAVAAQTPAAVLSGTVRSGDAAQAGVTVRAYLGEQTQVAGTATTGPDGAYKVPLVPGVYRVTFSGPGVDPALRTGVVVIDGSPNELNITLAKAGTSRPPESLDDVKPGEVAVRIDTAFGSIFIAVDEQHAPITAANFLKYVDGGFYTNGRFHRATRPDNYTPVLPNRPPMELIQGGIDPARADKGFPPIPLERTSVTGLKHVAGTVSMARGTAADSATSDFFILLDDQPSLDFGGKRFDDEQGAAAFGRVYFGFGAAKNIQLRPAEGQNLTPPVLMLRVARINPVVK
jgi:peptidyl-prolyl cis-trans isomerase A (cyclophilin A)